MRKRSGCKRVDLLQCLLSTWANSEAAQLLTLAADVPQTHSHTLTTHSHYYNKHTDSQVKNVI